MGSKARADYYFPAMDFSSSLDGSLTLRKRDDTMPNWTVYRNSDLAGTPNPDAKLNTIYVKDNVSQKIYSVKMPPGTTFNDYYVGPQLKQFTDALRSSDRFERVGVGVPENIPHVANPEWDTRISENLKKPIYPKAKDISFANITKLMTNPPVPVAASAAPPAPKKAQAKADSTATTDVGLVCAYINGAHPVRPPEGVTVAGKVCGGDVYCKNNGVNMGLNRVACHETKAGCPSASACADPKQIVLAHRGTEPISLDSTEYSFKYDIEKKYPKTNAEVILLLLYSSGTLPNVVPAPTGTAAE